MTNDCIEIIQIWVLLTWQILFYSLCLYLRMNLHTDYAAHLLKTIESRLDFRVCLSLIKWYKLST